MFSRKILEGRQKIMEVRRNRSETNVTLKKKGRKFWKHWLLKFLVQYPNLSADVTMHCIWLKVKTWWLWTLDSGSGVHRVSFSVPWFWCGHRKEWLFEFLQNIQHHLSRLSISNNFSSFEILVFCNTEVERSKARVQHIKSHRLY